MIKRFRQFEAKTVTGGVRQLVVAVTANSSEYETCSHEGFDQIYSKPLGMKEIFEIVHKNFK